MPQSTEMSLSPARVLVVEDDDDLRELIVENLTDAGFEVVEARDGEAFIDRLSATLADEGDRAFDVILSDIHMPSFSALDVLVGARQLIGDTPVILITAFGDPQTHDRALLRGAAVVLDKPVRMAQLCETVASLALHSRARPPAAPAAL